MSDEAKIAEIWKSARRHWNGRRLAVVETWSGGRNMAIDGNEPYAAPANIVCFDTVGNHIVGRLRDCEVQVA